MAYTAIDNALMDRMASFTDGEWKLVCGLLRWQNATVEPTNTQLARDTGLSRRFVVDARERVEAAINGVNPLRTFRELGSQGDVNPLLTRCEPTSQGVGTHCAESVNPLHTQRKRERKGKKSASVKISNGQNLNATEPATFQQSSKAIATLSDSVENTHANVVVYESYFGDVLSFQAKQLLAGRKLNDVTWHSVCGIWKDRGWDCLNLANMLNRYDQIEQDTRTDQFQGHAPAQSRRPIPLALDIANRPLDL